MDRFNDYHFHNNLAVLLKKFTGDEGERVDMQKLYGYIGLFTLVALWWLIWPLTSIGIEPKFVIPHSAKMEGVLFANCFVSNFLCDYLWALGVVWTTPLVSALGVSLTIPLAMVADMVVHGQHYSAVYIIGSILVNDMSYHLIVRFLMLSVCGLCNGRILKLVLPED
ncbi:hypothetical protein C3L33_03725, partial [Rhododendron williamsianum]